MYMLAFADTGNALSRVIADNSSLPSKEPHYSFPLPCVVLENSPKGNPYALADDPTPATRTFGENTSRAKSTYWEAEGKMVTFAFWFRD